MNVRQLIELLSSFADDFGELPVSMGWNSEAEPGQVVAVKVYPDRLELRCEREAADG